MNGIIEIFIRNYMSLGYSEQAAKEIVADNVNEEIHRRSRHLIAELYTDLKTLSDDDLKQIKKEVRDE